MVPIGRFALSLDDEGVDHAGNECDPCYHCHVSELNDCPHSAPETTNFHGRLNRLRGYYSMSCETKDEKRLPPEVTKHPDGQVVEVDSIGVSTFYLPPSRCKTCDE